MLSPTKVCFVVFFPKDFSKCLSPTGKHTRPWLMLYLSLSRAVFSSCVSFGFPVFAAPLVLHEYLVSVELNFSDAAALNQLKNALNRTAYPIRLNGFIQVSGITFTTGTGSKFRINTQKVIFHSKKDFIMLADKTARIILNLFFLSPVCSKNRGSFQCRCENLHRWSCDQCLKYRPCDAITNNSCGCITSFPLDGQYCQPADQHSELYHHITSSVHCW